MKTEMFLKQAKQRFELIVPNGYFNIERAALGQGFTFRLGMIANPKDCISNIRMNDPAHTLIFLHGVSHDLTEELAVVEVEFNGCNIATLPDSPHMAMGRHKVPTRKFKQEPQKALKSLEKFFEKYREALKELAAEQKIYGQANIKPEYLDFEVNHNMNNN